MIPSKRARKVGHRHRTCHKASSSSLSSSSSSSSLLLSSSKHPLNQEDVNVNSNENAVVAVSQDSASASILGSVNLFSPNNHKGRSKKRRSSSLLNMKYNNGKRPNVIRSPENIEGGGLGMFVGTSNAAGGGLGMFLGKSSVGGSLMSATKNNSCMPESDVCTRGSAERKSIGSSEKRQRKERSKKVVKDVEKYSNDGLHRIRRNPAQQKSGKSVEQAGKETCFDGSESENYKEDIKTEKNRQGMMRIRKAPKTMRKLDIDIPGNASQDELPHYSALAVRNERRSSQKSYIIKKLKRRKLKHRSSKRVRSEYKCFTILFNNLNFLYDLKKRVQLTEIDDDDNDIDEDCSFGGNEFGDELEKNAMLTDDEKAMDCFEKGEVSRSTTDSLISDSKGL